MKSPRSSAALGQVGFCGRDLWRQLKFLQLLELVAANGDAEHSAEPIVNQRFVHGILGPSRFGVFEILGAIDLRLTDRLEIAVQRGGSDPGGVTLSPGDGQERQGVGQLCALLNALLGFQGQDRIASLEILNPNIDKDYLREHGVILDIKARDGRGQFYNIEVQVRDEPDYIKRSIYYLARLFGEQLEKGDSYSRITRTIGISLLDFDLFPDLKDLHRTYRFYDVEHQHELSDILEIHYIELRKFKIDKPQNLRTPFEKWLHILKFGDLFS